MLNRSLYYLAAGFKNLSQLENSENYDDLYEGLTVTIGLIEKCEMSLRVINPKIIDKVIEGINKDKKPHNGVNGEGVNKKKLIARLEQIKTNIEALKAASPNPKPNSQNTNNKQN